MREIDEKIGRVQRFLEEARLDGLLLTYRRNFAWAACGATNHVRLASELGVASLLILEDGRRFVVAGNNEMPRMLAEEVSCLGYEPVEFEWHEPGRKQTLIEDLLGGRAYGSDVPFGKATMVEERFARLRYALTPDEVQRYHKVGSECAAAIQEVCEGLEPGMTEFGIEAMAAESLIRRGLRPMVILVGTDERLYRYRHPVPTEKELGRYAMVSVNAQRHGLIASLTRSVHFGAPPQDLKEKHTKVRFIYSQLMSASRPDVEARFLFEKLKGWYAQAGVKEEWRLHHQGGAIGYREREWLLSQNSDETILERQAFAWNPTIAGVKDEDTILVRSDGCEVLTDNEEWPEYVTMDDAEKMRRPAILIR